MNGKRKRNRLLTVLLLPVLIFVYIVGWGMRCLGRQKRAVKTKDKPDEDYVSVLPAAFEDLQEADNKR